MKKKLAVYRCFYTSRTKGSISFEVQAKSVGHAAEKVRGAGFFPLSDESGGWKNLSVSFVRWA